MSPAPNQAKAVGELGAYREGWDAMMDLVTHGHSWSGRERQVCYLNERRSEGRFANASFVSGLDYRDDGRALGLVDWDGDGDVDLWTRNRTAPRLRLMNNVRGRGDKTRHLVLELEGTTSNRNAIGSVVEVQLAGERPLVRSVRAGDLFMSQSSRVLHFGLGDGSSAIEQVRVLWPGGEWESFRGLLGNARYVLRQGAGPQATRVEPRAGVAEFSPGELSGLPDRGRARVILPTPVPLFPSFRYRDRALKETLLEGSRDGLQLLVLWSRSCAACQHELPSLVAGAGILQEAGVEVLGLAVDELTEVAEVYAFMDQLRWPHKLGFLERGVLERLDLLQAALFDRAVPLAVPTALLVDSQQRVLAWYRGEFSVEEVAADAKALKRADAEALHALAPPFAGRWFTLPVPVAFVAENLGRRFGERFPDEALPYLHLAFEAAEGEKKQALRQELGERHRLLAQTKAEEGRGVEAAAAFDKALRYLPESAAICHNYGVFLAGYGQWEQARALLERALALEPGSEATREALLLLERSARREATPQAGGDR